MEVSFAQICILIFMLVAAGCTISYICFRHVDINVTNVKVHCGIAVLLLAIAFILYYSYYVDTSATNVQTMSAGNIGINILPFNAHQNNGTKYAVITASTPSGNESLSYVFYLPLTVLSWKRIGYETIVILIGTETQWTGSKVLHLVLTYLKRCATVQFIDAKRQDQVLLSQVVRLFVGCMLNQEYFMNNDTLVIGDADLWVLNGSYVPLPRYNEVISLNSECCGAFTHEDITYRMIPMCHVTASVHTWRAMIEQIGICPNSYKTIMKAISGNMFTASFIYNRTRSHNQNGGSKQYGGNKQYGRSTQDDRSAKYSNSASIRDGGNKQDIKSKRTRRSKQNGRNEHGERWYRDQIVLSILVKKYESRNGTSVSYIPRSWDDKRLDRSQWTASGIGRKIDAHLPKDGFIKWRKLIPLITWMYRRSSPTFKHIMRYHQQFTYLRGLG